MEPRLTRRSVSSVISLGAKTPKRWAPETGAATRVELSPLAVSAQPVHHGLIKSDQKIEWPDLPAVGVPGDLQVHSCRYRLHNLLGLMREKHHRQRRIGIR